MSHISESNSEDNKSSPDMEYHSESGTESETGDYTLSNLDQRDTILNVRFPMPYTFPKPYLTLQEVIDNASDQKWNIGEDPDEALHYIINHFNIDKVTDWVLITPHYTFEQVYYSTYVDPRQFKRLQELIEKALKTFRYNALAQQRLDIENVSNIINHLTRSHPIYCNVFYSPNRLHRTLHEHAFKKERNRQRPRP